MAAAVRGVTILQEELLKAKENLRDVDENIKKLTGREPGENRPIRRGPPQAREDFKGRERLFAAARRGIVDDFGSPPAKRRAFGTAPSPRGALSRLGPRVVTSRVRPPREDSGDEDDLPNKPALQSSVVVSDSKSRQDTIEQQSRDKAGNTRNRRMFGLLLGTLQRFKDEEKQKGGQEQKRKAVEQKLEDKAKLEKEELRRERSTLFNQRREQQTRLRRLEQKMELVEIHEDWEKQTKQLMNFIRTKAKPHIFFKPKLHYAGSDKKRRETCKVLEEIILERRKQLEEEIDELTKGSEDKDEQEEEMEEDAMEPEEKEVRHEGKHEHRRDRKHSYTGDKGHEEGRHHRNRDRVDSGDKEKHQKEEGHGSSERNERRHRKRTSSARSHDSDKDKENVRHTEEGHEEAMQQSSPEQAKEDSILHDRDSDKDSGEERDDEHDGVEESSKPKSDASSDIKPDTVRGPDAQNITSDQDEEMNES